MSYRLASQYKGFIVIIVTTTTMQNQQTTTQVPNSNHALFLSETEFLGLVVHKVFYNGYKFSLWYDKDLNLKDLEKTVAVPFGKSVRIGKSDRAYFAKFSSAKTGVSLTSYRYNGHSIPQETAR